jgi:hypothetical protein
MLCFKPWSSEVARIIVESRRRNSTSNHWDRTAATARFRQHKPQTGLHPPRFGVDKMEQLLTAVIVAPFVITMVGFAVAIAFAPAVPNEIAPATGHDHDSRQLHRAKPRRWNGKV